MQEDIRVYQVGLTLLPQVGDVLIRQLVAYCGGIRDVFEASHKELSAIPSIGTARAESICQHREEALRTAKKEVVMMDQKGYRLVSFLDDDYPSVLKEYPDAATTLVVWGDWPLEGPSLAVVGTRTPTEYGVHQCERIIAELKHSGVLVVSGLAYGIDAVAHKSALNAGLSTMAVLGNGLPKVYPHANAGLAKDIVEAGGCVISQFRSTKKPDREHFPMRNRTVAYLTDACLVIESKESGGSMITANYAFHNHKELFAVPGRTIDVCSEGCNKLIKAQMAQLVTSGEDVLKSMNWDKKDRGVQTSLPLGLTEHESTLVAVIREEPQIHIEKLQRRSELSHTVMATTLLSLELKGVIRQQAGNRYVLY